ncbi:cell division protein ZipA [Teredinibacter haidensis]|uniref:cell division protein ZipA n=1 Tax=Teredinibacter haidensis TaxID=2731755 RepID=UPI0009490429|nr:cell division protein ZipA [Teredinibacter haidensis]
MRDWLTVIIVLLIVGILLDGFRRMRQSRRASLQLSKNAEKADSRVETAVSSSEFPSGGARVAEYRDPEHATSVNQNLKQTYLSKKITVGAPNRIPEQVTLNLDEHVPMLMDSVAEEAPEGVVMEEELERVNEPVLGDLESLDDDVPAQEVRDPEPVPVREEPKNETRKAAQVKKEAKKEPRKTAPDEPSFQQPDEVLIINVMARSGMRFEGEALLSALMEDGMRLGAMDIFHRHINDDGDGPVLYSLANMVVPGTFNLAKMKEFETPGVSLFLSLPLEITDEDGELPEGLSIRAYDDMAATAKALALALNGELKDKNRSVMTQQTIEYDRQRVVEYERKQRLARA